METWNLNADSVKAFSPPHHSHHANAEHTMGQNPTDSIALLALDPCVRQLSPWIRACHDSRLPLLNMSAHPLLSRNIFISPGGTLGRLMLINSQPARQALRVADYCIRPCMTCQISDKASYFSRERYLICVCVSIHGNDFNFKRHWQRKQQRLES